VRKFRPYQLVILLLLYGIPIYLLVPPIFSAHEIDEGTVLRKDAGSTVVMSVTADPTHSLADYRAIWEQNVFKTGKGEAPAKEVAAAEIPEADPNLGLKLVGTVVAENSGRSVAIVGHDGTGQQEACWEGSYIGQVVIKRIFQDRVIIDAGKGDEVLAMEPGRGIGTRHAPTQLARLDREEVAATFPDYMSLVKTVSIRTDFQAGSPGGILIYNIEPDGLLDKIGLQNGDVIRAINGEPLRVSLDAVEIYNHLKQGGKITLAVQRGEENMQLEFQVS
jgi:type II secretory pathway component PulC